MPDSPKLVTTKLQRLHHRALAILTKEIGHLEKLAISEKLNTGPAKDLRDYIKLLGELKETSKQLEEDRAREEKEAASKSSDEALAEVIKISTPQ